MAGLSISERCRRAGIDRKTYYQRLARGETDLFAPPKIQKRHIPDETRKLMKEKGISKSTYFSRLSRGWSEFEASNVVPHSDILKINGKSVWSQLTRSQYSSFYVYMDRYGLSMEEAFERVTKGKKNDSTKHK